jgi:hypothetical protein
MYFIMRGEMRMMDESLTVCYNALYSGAYFGELSMLTDHPRSATALAVADCVLFYINQHDFNHVVSKWPIALATIITKCKERVERIDNPNSQMLAKELAQKLKEIPAQPGDLDEPSAFRASPRHTTPALRGVCHERATLSESSSEFSSPAISHFRAPGSLGQPARPATLTRDNSERRRTRFCEDANTFMAAPGDRSVAPRSRSLQPGDRSLGASQTASRQTGENGVSGASVSGAGGVTAKNGTAIQDTLALILQRLTEQGEQIAELKKLHDEKQKGGTPSTGGHSRGNYLSA